MRNFVSAAQWNSAPAAKFCTACLVLSMGRSVPAPATQPPGQAMDALCEELNALCREQLSGITIARVGDRLLREKGGAK